jgi:hypothetical protein
MNYAIEMGSGAMMYVPRYTKIASAVQKLLVGWGRIYAYGHIDSKVIS